MKIKSLIKLEVAITFILFLYYTGALGLQNPVGNNDLSVYIEPQRNLIEKAIAALSYLLIPILISRKWKLCTYLLTKDIPLFSLLFLANYSIIWADINLNNNISLLRGLLLSTMFGVYLAARYSIKDQMRFLAAVFAIVILSSIFAALFLPGYGTHPGGHLTGWTGIFQHKNLLGAHMAWSASVFLSLSLSTSQKHLIRFALWIGFAFSLLLVFLSGSAGGIINLVCVISIVPLSKFIRKTYYKLQVLLINSVILVVTCTSVLVTANLETIAQSLGKDLTFSGRIPMWSRLIDYVAQKPFLGYGFNGFWPGEFGANFRARWISWKTVPHSHNGFLELVLALGLIGFVLFIISCIFLFLRAYKEAYQAKTFEDILPLQFLCTFILANLSESRLLIPNNIYWIFYVTMSLSLALKHIRERKLSMV